MQGEKQKQMHVILLFTVAQFFLLIISPILSLYW